MLMERERERMSRCKTNGEHRTHRPAPISPVGVEPQSPSTLCVEQSMGQCFIDGNNELTLTVTRGLLPLGSSSCQEGDFAVWDWGRS